MHAKVGIVDDVWASVGSDNINRRSWTHDSELACAVVDDRLDGGARSRSIRRRRTSLFARAAPAAGRRTPGPGDRTRSTISLIRSPRSRHSQPQHQRWRKETNTAPAPDRPGQLVPYPLPELSGFTRA